MGRWLPTGATVRAMRDVTYFPDAVHAEPFVVLGIWAVASSILFAVARVRRYGWGSVPDEFPTPRVATAAVPSSTGPASPVPTASEPTPPVTPSPVPAPASSVPAGSGPSPVVLDGTPPDQHHDDQDEHDRGGRDVEGK